MSIRAVFVDMDGTLLNPQHQISDYTASVLKRLKEKGVYFIVATGRAYAEVLVTLQRNSLKPDFIITSNGGRTHDGNFVVVREHNIPADLAVQLVQMGTDASSSSSSLALNTTGKAFVTNVYRNTDWLTDTDVPSISGEMHKDLPCTVLGADLYKLSARDLEGVHQVWYYGELAALHTLNNELTATFGSQLCWTFSGPDMIDCGPVNVTKGNAVREVSEMLGVALSEVACFGDGMNDESMLQIAGKAFIMANGQAELKAAVKHGEVIGSNAEDGVAKKLEELFFS